MSGDIGLGIAFIAGLASVLAPCVLPLVPAYLGYLTGHTVSDTSADAKERLTIVIHAVFFVLGFSIVFITLGVAANTIGRLIKGDILRYIGGTIIILFGLHLTGLLRLSFLEQDARLQWQVRNRWGFLSSLLVGMVFAAGWTPCVGPALSAILVLSAKQDGAMQGILLLTAYSAGVGVPFILAGFLLDRSRTLIVKLSPYLATIQKISGIIIIITGIVVLTDSFSLIGAWLEQRGIGWDLGI
ncbi:MAG: cytochrome c biogenesis protein CcdA [Anaerolineae bacterium]|nr:cytochrome c biogenesis protein CcdA [Anaerolineae bacterium]